ncbi:zinc finger protein 544-like isoform X4 [Pleurodeles waltl]|uniref:zinc finger protein 544-like isoform X4 n=1 Tax=Pleurodeles waltl TaxID=8319 RepID=UPI0037094B22
MSWQDSDKAPVTFRDVAAYFSQEEWKLLHEWQKELYKNIMNDIQQALISLGPLVAASVFSLRSKEKEDVCLVNCQESEQIPSVNNFPGDVINSEDLIFRIHAEENLLIRNPLDLERDKKNDCVNTGYPVHNPEIGLRKDAESSASLMEEPGVKLRGGSADPSRGHAITTSLVSVCPKKEGADYIMDRSDCERRESSAPPSAGYPYPKTDFALRNEEAATVCLIDHYDVEEQEMRMNPIKGHAVTPLDISVCIKEEEEVYSVEHHDIERMDSGSSPTGVSTVISFSVKEEDRHHPIDQQETGEEERIINPAGDVPKNRKSKDRDTIKWIEKAADQKISREKSKVDILQSTNVGTFPRSQRWSERNRELVGEKVIPWDSSVSHSAELVLHPKIPLMQRSEKYSKCDCGLKNAKLYSYQRGKQTKWTTFSCTECDQSSIQKRSLSLNQRKYSGERAYQCNKCEKSFSRKFNLSVHQRTHTGERPYPCTQCGKSFSRRFTLCVHQRTHVVERS